jgi:lipid II:glycine glycyltransferase (peptidoglycan interpeptide bridge formation enzyme)
MNKQLINKNVDHPIQTWEWEEFRRAWGNETERIKYKSKSKKNISLLVTFSKIPYTPWKIGTALKGPKPTKEQLEELKALGKGKKAIFIKLEPSFAKSNLATEGQAQYFIKLLKAYGCVKGRRLFTPETFWIDLSKSEEELLAGFSPKTRYNIRLAQRRGVTIVEDDSDKAFNTYLKLTFKTAKRQGFFTHTERYHRLMWKYLHKTPKFKNSKTPIARLLVAKHKGEILTTWIVFVWKDFLYYPYGASSDKHREVMANNLMMWEAIRFGKKLGLKTFDLWGREEGKGFTRFKEGYNPEVVKFIGSWDLVINKPVYWIYRIAEFLRWKILKLLN